MNIKIIISLATLVAMYTGWSRTVQEINKDITAKKNEWTKLQKENPGCVLEDNSKQQQAIVKRAGVKGHRNHFGSKQTTYVRDSYYCTFCKHDSAFDETRSYCCKKGANAYNAWLYQRKNVAVTQATNEKIDAVMKEIEVLEQELKVEVDRQKEEQQKKNLEMAEKRNVDKKNPASKKKKAKKNPY